MITYFYILLILAIAGFSIYLHFQNKNLKQSVNTLTKSIDDEKEIETYKQSFVATITHDLKTPTNAQINILNLLLKENFGKLNPEQREMLTLTQNSCKYMSELIAIIMDTYNYDYGGIKLNLEDFDVINLINYQCKSLKLLAKHRRQKIIFNQNFKNLTIHADKLQIKRVIQNLLSNAITYSYQNSKIFVNLHINDNNIEFFVENMSKPIPQSELNTIFDKYKKTKFSYFNKGSNGLGLYLSKQIIEMHQGKVYAKSFKDGKCVFGFEIPICKTQNVAPVNL